MGFGRTAVGRIARDGDTRLEQLTSVGLILYGDPYWYRLEALKAGGGFKVRALLAAVQRHPALGTIAAEVDVGRQRRRAIEAAGRCHRLH